MSSIDGQGGDVFMSGRARPNMAWQFSELSAAAGHLRGGHVVISSFDGVHMGHLALLNLASGKAAAAGGHVVALLFEEPAADSLPLACRSKAVDLLRGAGGEVLLLGFEQRASWLDLAAFCDLVRELEPNSVTMEGGFRFGRNGTLSAHHLADRLCQFGVATEVIGPVAAAHGFGTITSDKIRAYLTAGDLCAANYLLGRCWSIEGPVVHGYKRGRELGFPTANIQPGRPLPLAHGIYAVRVQIRGKTFHGVASYGTRPQFDNGAPLLEVHILDFSGDLYGAEASVEFVSRQRAELVFNSVDDLIAQMEIDRTTARGLLCQADLDLGLAVAQLK